MRLIEVVMLMGAHCVSPVEHTGMTTDATKVHCAVVMEKDTERGTLTVTPREAARDPLVAAAAERFRLAPVDGPGGTRIVPAWGPAGSPATEIKRAVPQPATAPVARATAPPPSVAQPPAVPPAAAEPPVPEQRLATLSPPAAEGEPREARSGAARQEAGEAAGNRS